MGRHLAALALAALALAACHDNEFKRYPLEIHMAGGGDLEMAPGDTLLLEPKIVYNDRATYSWTDQDGNVVSSEQNLLFVPTAMTDYHFTFRATNDLGDDTLGVRVRVRLNADFNELDNFATLKRKSGLHLLPDTLPGAFRMAWADFASSVNDDTTSWSGFAFSNKTGVQNLLNEAARGAAYVPNSTKANNYLAVRAVNDEATITFRQTYAPLSIDVANDNQIYLASKFGYQIVSIEGPDTVRVDYPPAAQNDYYRLQVLALGPDGQPTGPRVDFDLIECSYDNPAKYFRLVEWHTLDLRPLGRASGLLLRTTTSLPNNLPPQLCVDNLKVQDYVAGASKRQVLQKRAADAGPQDARGHNPQDFVADATRPNPQD